ncbi:MAG: NAD(P)-dependent oxidoreductase [Dehalococcoidia bacterium]|nr:NAD(P)-dependent oxidoreductase [Dehalococcoidia bacterium]MSQ34795.1 NAD(P)-dependent oxidoreductase [Dehalococcoidia bacterium]
MSLRKKVLITGASGYVASLLLPEFRDRYDLVLVDNRNKDRTGKLVPGITIADVADSDRSKYQSLFAGVDAVVHLAYRHSSRTSDVSWGADVPPIERFDVELSNVQMAQNIYRAAYDAGVRRVVVASSNHAADWYEHALVHAGRKDMVFPHEVPISDNFYGWAKAAYELLAFPYASGIFGRKLQCVLVRIGNPYETDGPGHIAGENPSRQHGGTGESNFKRNLGAHLSARDCRQLFTKSIDAPAIENEHGVPWLVVYGISGNTRAFWSLETARRALGYAPQDDSEIKFATDVYKYLTGPGSSAGPDNVGL